MPAIKNIIPLSGTVPNGYEQVLNWRVSEKRSRAIGLQLASIPLFIVFGLLFFGVAINLGWLSARITFGLSEIGLVLAGILLTLVLHELTHGVVMQMFGAQPRYGVLWKQAMFYATTPGYAYRRNQYLCIALAPFVALSGLMGVGMWALSGTFWVALFGLCGAINASGAAGDFWMTRIVLGYEASAYVIDERDGIRVFLPNPLKLQGTRESI